MTLDVADAVDDLRQLIARADALANATEDLFNNPFDVKDREDRCGLERVAHLVGAPAAAVLPVLTESLAQHYSRR